MSKYLTELCHDIRAALAHFLPALKALVNF